MSFTFQTVPQIEFGTNSTEKIRSVLNTLGAERPMVITDAGIVNAGIVGLFKAALGREFVDQTHWYTDVVADPPDHQVMACAEQALESNCDCVIGLGGGSSMDVAKVVAVLLANPSADLESMYGVDVVRLTRVPLVQVPTTAGTGSEVTPISILTTGEHSKAGIVNKALYADAVLLDPTLTIGLPKAVTAATGIDAMVHAIEAFTSKRLKNPISDNCAIQALGLLAGNIKRVVDNGEDVEARGAMLLGAMLAGQAFANAPVGGVHALAYPIGGQFHVPHGLSNSLVLPHVLRFNGPEARAQYKDLANIILAKYLSTNSADSLADYFIDLALYCELPTKLSQVGIQEKDINLLAENAMLQERLLINNPRTITQQDAHDIYAAAF